MSLLRALRAYVGLGPDEEIEDRYLYELNSRRRQLDLDEYRSDPEPEEPVHEPPAPAVEEVAPPSDRIPTADIELDRLGLGDLRFDELADIELALDDLDPGVDGSRMDERRVEVRPVGHDGVVVMGSTARVDSPHDDGGGAVVHSLDSMRAKPRTLAPESFADAKLVADEFKRDIPVLLNLQAVDRDLARRLIDFASGICYVLDGSMEKIATQVFLLIPDGIEVSEDDRRRIEERGYAR